MDFSRTFALVAFVSLGFGSLVGCGNAEQDDVDALNAAISDSGELDLDALEGMETELGQELASVLREADAANKEFAENTADFQPDVFFTPENMSDPAKREEFSASVANYRTELATYRDRSVASYDAAAKLAEENGTDDDLEQFANMREKFLSLYDAQVELLDKCDEVTAVLNDAEPTLDAGQISFTDQKNLDRFQTSATEMGAAADAVVQAERDFESARSGGAPSFDINSIID